MGKNSLNIFICHLSWLKKLCPYSYTSPQNHSWIFETLRVIIFWVRVSCKMLNVNWENIHSIFLSVTCHGLRNFAPTHTHPLKAMSWIFKTLWVIIFWVRVTCKMLNVTWDKNSLNIFICHLLWLKKLCPCSYTSPQNHLWIVKTVWVIIFWVRVTHKMLNVNWEKIHSIILSVTCHGLRNFPLLIHIPSKPFMNFWNPVIYYFFELESLVKCWMWLV